MPTITTSAIAPSNVENAVTLSDAPKTTLSILAEKATKQFQKLTQMEHIKERPDMFIGSIEPTVSIDYTLCPILDDMDDTTREMILENFPAISHSNLQICPEIGYVNFALQKIFDEILVNASDNRERTKNHHIPEKRTQNIRVYIRVEQHPQTKEDRLIIRVCNDGQSIPIVKHQIHDMYIPQMIFGELNSGSNYDKDVDPNDNANDLPMKRAKKEKIIGKVLVDENGNEVVDESNNNKSSSGVKEKRLWGGCNGLGAKLANCFSHKFSVGVNDLDTNLSYRQSWFDGMTKRSNPKISALSSMTTCNLTSIEFEPDLSVFKLPGGIRNSKQLRMMYRRVYDIAAQHCDIKVYLNDTLIPIRARKDFVKMINVDTGRLNIDFYTNQLLSKQKQQQQQQQKNALSLLDVSQQEAPLTKVASGGSAIPSSFRKPSKKPSHTKFFEFSSTDNYWQVICTYTCKPVETPLVDGIPIKLEKEDDDGDENDDNNDNSSNNNSDNDDDNNSGMNDSVPKGKSSAKKRASTESSKKPTTSSSGSVRPLTLSGQNRLVNLGVSGDFFDPIECMIQKIREDWFEGSNDAIGGGNGRSGNNKRRKLISSSSIVKQEEDAVPIGENNEESGGGMVVHSLSLADRKDLFESLTKLIHQPVSFVNGVYLRDGGTHVNYMRSKIISGLKSIISEKRGASKSGPIKDTMIEGVLNFYVWCNVENPRYVGQIKSSMTTPPALFGTKCDFNTNVKCKQTFVKMGEDKVLMRILRGEAIQADSSLLNKTDGLKVRNILGYSKLQDANKAGTKESDRCVLFLTEGDSAKSMATRGFSTIGSDYYGAFPLRGKLINTREVTPQKLEKNAEYVALKKIIGLREDCKYETEEEINGPCGLRYRRVCILTDQDHDGAHIAALIMNFFESRWPNLVYKHNFLTRFVTPIVKLRPKDDPKTHVSFFSMHAFEKWANDAKSSQETKRLENSGITKVKKNAEDGDNDDDMKNDDNDDDVVVGRDNHDDDVSDDENDEQSLMQLDKMGSERIRDWERFVKTYRIKYYKGLGTSNPKECDHYFANMNKHNLNLGFDETSDRQLFDQLFMTKFANNRKSWMLANKANVDENMKRVEAMYACQKLSVEVFLNTEMSQFSEASCDRALPGRDGLKIGQRKIADTVNFMHDKSPTKQVKVTSLQSALEAREYEHGESSSQTTTIGMCQTFMGANNAPLIYGDGQFGTRDENGKDFAAPRYLFCGPSKFTRVIFPKADTSVLERRLGEQGPIEPDNLQPIVNVALLNGSAGIGTGWSTEIPPYDPHEITSIYREWIDTGSDAFMEKYVNSVKAGTSEKRVVYPWYRGFKGKVILSSAKPEKFVMYGTIDIENDDEHWAITEIAPGISKSSFAEQIEKHLIMTGLVKTTTVDHYRESVRWNLFWDTDQLQALEEKLEGCSSIASSKNTFGSIFGNTTEASGESSSATTGTSRKRKSPNDSVVTAKKTLASFKKHKGNDGKATTTSNKSKSSSIADDLTEGIRNVAGKGKRFDEVLNKISSSSNRNKKSTSAVETGARVVAINEQVVFTKYPNVYNLILKMTSASVSTTNMHTAEPGFIALKHDSIFSIINMHAIPRMECYKRRYAFEIERLMDNHAQASEKKRFILLIISDKLVIRKRPRKEIEREMLDVHKFEESLIPKLLKMPLYSQTMEKVSELEGVLTKIEEELEIMRGKTPAQIWKEELDTFDQVFTSYVRETKIECRPKSSSDRNRSKVPGSDELEDGGDEYQLFASSSTSTKTASKRKVNKNGGKALLAPKRSITKRKVI